MQIIPYDEAFANFEGNPYSRWPRERDQANRLEPICQPGFLPKFMLPAGEKVFTIGSCFARNVENALAARGFDVVTRKILEAGQDFVRFGPNILNNYGVPSICNELDWTLNSESAFDEAANFAELSPGNFVAALALGAGNG